MPGFAGSPSTIAVLNPRPSGSSTHFRSSEVTRFTGSGVADRCCPKIGELDSRSPTDSAATPSPPRVSRFHVVFMRGILTENGVSEQIPQTDIFFIWLDLLHAIGLPVYIFVHWKLRETDNDPNIHPGRVRFRTDHAACGRLWRRNGVVHRRCRAR